MKIGRTYIHEHIKLDLSGPKKDPDTNYDDTQGVIEELKELKKKGISCIVDVTNRGMGRDAQVLSEVAKQTGLTIIASTGFYKEPFLPAYFYESSDAELFDMLVADIERGMDGTGLKARVLGEVGSSHNTIKASEQRLFNLIADVHLHTGRPIFTHTTLGTMALEQIDILAQKSVDPTKVLIGHMDLNPNLDYHLKVAGKGCYLGFDTIGKINYQPDENRVRLIKELVARGHEDQIVLSLDLTRKSHLKKHGGIGYSYLVDIFLPLLTKAELKEETINKFLVDNPRKLLSIP